MITTLCEWLSLGYLYENTARGSKDGYLRADRYIKKATDNMKQLNKFEADLVDSGGAKIPDNVTDMQILGGTEDYSPTFDEGSPLDWRVSDSKLTDLSGSKN